MFWLNSYVQSNAWFSFSSLINKLKPGIIKKVNRRSTPIAGLVSDAINVLVFYANDVHDGSTWDVLQSSVAFQQMLNMFLFIRYTCKCGFLFGLQAIFWWFHTSLIAKFAQSNSRERSIVTSHHGQMIGILQQEPKMLLQQRGGSCSDSRDDLYWQACGLLGVFLFVSSNSIKIDPNLHRCGFSIKKYAIIIDYQV